LPDKKHHEHSTREARHELPGGKQGEDKHEQGKEEPGQALVRYLPGGGAVRHGGRLEDWTKRHEHECH